MNDALGLGNGTVPAATPAEPTVLELEDTLYDILASGADPSLAVGTLEAVQTFLHEHARSKRSRAEFMAFFAEHGITIAREPTLEIDLPPMELRAQDPLPAAPLSELRMTPTAPAPIAPPAVVRAPKPAVAASRRGFGWLYGLVALAAASGGAYIALSRAQAELDLLHAESRANSQRLAEVKAEAEALRRSLEQNAELVRRIDQKSELLLQSLVSPLDPNTR